MRPSLTLNQVITCLLIVLSAIPAMAQRSATILDHQDRIRISPVRAINSRYRETNLSISPDGKYLYFMSLRGEQEWSSIYMTFRGDSVYDGDIWVSERVGGQWQRPEVLPFGVNTAQGEDEPVVTADGKRVYFQSWHYLWDSNGGPYYYSQLEGSRWTRPVGLGGGITEFFRTIQATDGMTISPDERTFIVAAGVNYDGPMDIFMSRKGPYGWTFCRKLGISTSGDERSVFLAPDGKSLYFASNAYDGFGGMDIYKTTLNPDGTFGEVINIGEPFNTPQDDYGFVLTGDGMEAYFVRNGDIYFADLRDADERIRPDVPEITHILKGTVRDSISWTGVQSEVLLFDARTRRLVKKVTTSPSGAYRIELPNKSRVYDQLVMAEGYPQKTRRLTIDQKAYGETLTANFLLANPSGPSIAAQVPPQTPQTPQPPRPQPTRPEPVAEDPEPEPSVPAITQIDVRPQQEEQYTPPPTVVPPAVTMPAAADPYSFEGVAENNLVLLLDVSASMRKPGKLPLLKTSFAKMLDHMRPEDQVTVIVYSGSADVVIEAVSASQKEVIEAAISTLSGSGGTKGKAALRKAYNLARRHFIEGGNNRIIMATDGYFDVPALYDMAESGSTEDVSLSVFSFGNLAQNKINELSELAAKGGGNYQMIDEANVDTALLNEAKAVRR